MHMWFVVLTVCADGYFGAQCRYQCHCAEPGDICDKTVGWCRSQCAAGWTGADCQTGVRVRYDCAIPRYCLRILFSRPFSHNLYHL